MIPTSRSVNSARLSATNFFKDLYHFNFFHQYKRIWQRFFLKFLQSLNTTSLAVVVEIQKQELQDPLRTELQRFDAKLSLQVVSSRDGKNLDPSEIFSIL